MELIVNGISRRNFLATAAALAGGAAVAGLAGCSQSEGNELAETKTDTEWAGEADVIVIGYGNAGIGATKGALDEGGSVIILEKAPAEFAGGSLCANDGNWSIVSQEALINGSFGVMGQSVANAINEEGPLFGDWLEECGVEWQESKNSVGQMVRSTENGRMIWNAANDFLSQNENVKIVYDSPCVKLIKNEADEIIGAAVNQNGELVNYKARKGVVIATGTYASNPDFVQGHHYACLPYASGTSPYNTGDGMVLAAKAGGRSFQDLSLAIEFGPLSCRAASEELGMAMPLSSLYSKGIMVNGEGKRFMSESNLMDHNKTTEPILQIKCTNKGGKAGNWGNGYFNLPAWVVLDAATFQSEPLGRPFGWVNTFEVYDWSDDNQAELDKGWILSADTIEELASKMTSKNSMTGEDIVVDAEGLKQTIAEYNAAVEAGIDPLGKNEMYLVPVGEGPYYAVEVIPSVMYTNNGITVNDEMQVLDWEGNPLPRLYAAGDVASRERACRICMPGNAVTGAMASRHAMGLEGWEA